MLFLFLTLLSAVFFGWEFPVRAMGLTLFFGDQDVGRPHNMQCSGADNLQVSMPVLRQHQVLELVGDHVGLNSQVFQGIQSRSLYDDIFFSIGGRFLDFHNSENASARARTQGPGVLGLPEKRQYSSIERLKG